MFSQFFFFFFASFAEGLGCSELGSMEADPDDCGSFLLCNHNVYQKMACRDGTHYDPQVKVCNHPDLFESRTIESPFILTDQI